MKDNNRNANNTTVTLNSTSRGCKAKPYPFSASAVIQSLFKLGNGETCQGLRHWRLLSNLKDNFSKPVRNDMQKKILKRIQDDNIIVVQDDVATCAPLVGEPKSLISKGGKNALDCNQEPSPEFVSSSQLNKLGNSDTCKGLLRRFVHKITNNNEISPHNDMVNKNRNELINLSTYRLIDFKKKIAFTLAEGATHVDLPPTKVKLAFTLAEVLITLGIIGIVAAMTIPGLIETYQKKATAEKLKEMYSIITQAAKMYTNDTETEFGSFDTQLSEKEFLDKYFSSYVKVVLKCAPGSDCYKNQTPLTINRKTKIVPPPYIIGLLNGAYIGVLKRSGGALFYVDLNGAGKPNVSGRDIFYFYLINVDTVGEYYTTGCEAGLEFVKKFKSGLYPGSFGSCFVPHVTSTRKDLLTNNKIDRACNKDAVQDSRQGDACAAVIMMDGWKISKDYPW